MKIAMVTPAYAPAMIGVAGYCTDLAETLVSMGHSVDVFTPYVIGWEQRETINDVAVRRIRKIQLTESYYFSCAFVRAIAAQRYDIVHSHHYGYFPATAGLAAAKLRKTPHVFNPHYHPPIYGLARKIMASAYHATQGLPLLRCSDAVLPHTHFEKNMLLRLGTPEAKIRVLPSTVDTKKFPLGAKKEKIILFVSSFIQEKGASVAREIAENITKKRRDVKFIFVGEGPERPKSAARIEVYPRLPFDELVALYKKAMAIILPSKYEAFARVLAEAQSCGCAAIATRVGGIPEVVKDGETGFLVDYGDWKTMEKKIEYLLDNPSVARKMGVLGSKRVRENFDSHVVVGKLISVYKEAMNQ